MENNFPAPASDFRPPIKLECSLTAFLIVDNNCKIQKLKSCKKRIRSFIRWCDLDGGNQDQAATKSKVSC